MMMPKTPDGLQIMDYPAMPMPVDDGARERLAAIVAFFETRCENCVEHYCPECTDKFKDLLLEARDYLEDNN
jgi:hypothetical protein